MKKLFTISLLVVGIFVFAGTVRMIFTSPIPPTCEGRILYIKDIIEPPNDKDNSGDIHRGEITEQTWALEEIDNCGDIVGSYYIADKAYSIDGFDASDNPINQQVIPISDLNFKFYADVDGTQLPDNQKSPLPTVLSGDTYFEYSIFFSINPAVGKTYRIDFIRYTSDGTRIDPVTIPLFVYVTVNSEPAIPANLKITNSCFVASANPVETGNPTNIVYAVTNTGTIAAEFDIITKLGSQTLFTKKKRLNPGEEYPLNDGPKIITLAPGDYTIDVTYQIDGSGNNNLDIGSCTNTFKVLGATQEGTITLLSPGTEVDNPVAETPYDNPTFKWLKMTNATKYELFVNVKGGSQVFYKDCGLTTNSVSTTTLVAGTEYEWYVKATSPNGTYDSPKFYFKPPAAELPPTNGVVTLLEPGISTTQTPIPVICTTNPIYFCRPMIDAVSYAYSVKEKTGSYKITNRIVTSNYAEPNEILDVDKEYEWQVIAKRQDGSTVVSEWFHFKTPTQAQIGFSNRDEVLLIKPGNRTLIPPPVVYTLTPEFFWSYVVGATSYSLTVSDVATGQNVFQTPPITNNKYTPPPSLLVFDKVYRWQVSATKGGNPISSVIYHFRTFSSLNTTCQITDINKDVSVTEYKATQYLCGLSIVEPKSWSHNNPFGVKPMDDIARIDLAKITALGLFGSKQNEPNILFTNKFPTPFLDLSQNYTNYFRFAKFLSYLDFNDEITPFDGDKENFYAGDPIKNRYTLKVLLEAFDVPCTLDANGAKDYIQTALNIGLIDNSFQPDENTKRVQAFVWLYKIMSGLTNPAIAIPTLAELNLTENYLPANFYKPENFADIPALQDGNFEHHETTSFAFAEKKLPLVFTHIYQSYSVSMPKDFYTYKPMGVGWTHSFHSYIKVVKGYIFDKETSVADHILIFWPGSMSPHVFKQKTLSPVTQGIYYTVKANTAQFYEIEDLSKTKYTFEKHPEDPSVYLLTKIEEKNGNRISLFYGKVGQAGKEKRRLREVVGNSGKKILFDYSIEEFPKLKSVYASEDNNNTPVVEFGYTDDDLTSYTDLLRNTTSYYYGIDKAKHLLKVIKLPKGNFIYNDYAKRKLTSTKSSSDINGTVANSKVNVQQSFNSVSGGFESTVSDDAGNVLAKVNRDDIGNIIQTSFPNTNNGDNNVKYKYENKSDKSLVTQIDKYAAGNSNPVSTTNIEYNAFAQKTKVTLSSPALAAPISEIWAYNNDHTLASYTNPKGYSILLGYNTNGNVTSITDFDNKVTLVTPGADGLVRSIKTPTNVIYNYELDKYGMVVSASSPVSTTKAVYDIWNRKQKDIDPLGYETSYVYTWNNLLKEVKDPMGYTTSYNYDPNYNLTHITNALGRTTEMSYNFETDLLVKQKFGNTEHVFDWDNEGKLNYYKNNLHQFKNTYYSNKLLKADDYLYYIYDDRNRLKEIYLVNETTNRFVFTYDDLDRVVSYTYSYPESLGIASYTVGYEYDVNNNVSAIIYPNGEKVRYEYDKNDRLVKVTDWLGNEYTANRRANGSIDNITFPNQTRRTYGYDKADRLTAISVKNQKTNEIFMGYSFVLDARGSQSTVTSIEPLTAGPLNEIDITFNHDDENRLISDSKGGSYDHNDNGNLSTHPKFKNMNWNMVDMLTHIESNDPQVYFSHDYTYDPKGNRVVAKRNGITTSYALDISGMGNILMENDNGNITYYIHGFGMMARIKADNSMNFYHSDIRGSVICMTDKEANITHKYSYGTFGHVIAESEPAGDMNRFRYVGALGVMYESADLYFMRARFYDLSTMRFISEDPIWSTELYSYAGNNPMTFVDPNGREFESAVNSFSASFKYNYNIAENYNSVFKPLYFESEGIADPLAGTLFFSLKGALVQLEGERYAPNSWYSSNIVGNSHLVYANIGAKNYSLEAKAGFDLKAVEADHCISFWGIDIKLYGGFSAGSLKAGASIGRKMEIELGAIFGAKLGLEFGTDNNVCKNPNYKYTEIEKVESTNSYDVPFDYYQNYQIAPMNNSYIK